MDRRTVRCDLPRVEGRREWLHLRSRAGTVSTSAAAARKDRIIAAPFASAAGSRQEAASALICSLPGRSRTWRWENRAMLKLDGLEAFVAVVEAGSISAAARRLGCAKSAVRDRFADRERTVGVQLVQCTAHTWH
jgi:hypothetical protein